jgi:hypothetical protein
VGPAISCGQTISTNIITGGELDAYRFSGTVGDVAVVSVYGSPGYPNYFNAVASVYTPAGVRLGGCVDGATNLTLAVNGTYTILVHADNYASSGPYGLTLQSARAGCGSPISVGRTVTNSIRQASEIDSYTVSGANGNLVAFSVYGSPNYPNYFNAVGDVYDPSGVRVGSCVNGATNLALAATGTYTILVHADNYSSGGPYGLSWQSTLGQAGPAISCGQTISTNIITGGELDAYRFSGTAGDVAVVSAYGSPNYPNYFNVVADVYTPAGVRLGGCVNRATNLALAVTGTYTILVHADNYASGGPYALTLQSARAGCGSPISLGCTMTNSIRWASEIDSYTFAGTAGRQVALSIYGSPGYPNYLNGTADIYDPSGNRLSTVVNGTTNEVLPSYGIYSILVHADTYANTGTYRVSISCTGAVVILLARGQFLPDGCFRLEAYGVIGEDYTLQASTNLVNWVRLLDFICTNAPTYVVDPEAMNFTRRFYRVAPYTTVPPLRLDLGSVHPWTTTGLALKLDGPLGENCWIEASTNLVNWLEVTSFLSTVSPVYFRDSAATNFSRRFYRAVIP